jgi:hypothetical protein
MYYTSKLFHIEPYAIAPGSKADKPGEARAFSRQLFKTRLTFEKASSLSFFPPIDAAPSAGYPKARKV